jgi:hypothetical protein
MTDINRLAERTACHLAGRQVKVKWLPPPVGGVAVGQATKRHGQLIIYVDDWASVNQKLETLLHETAHCKNDAAAIPDIGNRPRKEVGHQTPEVLQAERVSWNESPREKRAIAQAAEWIAYAEENYWKYFPQGVTIMERKLLCLLDY